MSRPQQQLIANTGIMKKLYQSTPSFKQLTDNYNVLVHLLIDLYHIATELH